MKLEVYYKKFWKYKDFKNKKELLTHVDLMKASGFNLEELNLEILEAVYSALFDKDKKE